MQRIIASLLSLFILLSSSGITFAQHYCGGNPIASKITLGEEALSCNMNAVATDACTRETKIEKHSCCDDKYLAIDTDSHYNKAKFEIQFLDFDFPALEWGFLVPKNTFDSKTTNFQVYRPPPLEKDYQILFETFLI